MLSRSPEQDNKLKLSSQTDQNSARGKAQDNRKRKSLKSSSTVEGMETREANTSIGLRKSHKMLMFNKVSPHHCGEMRGTAFKRRELFQDVICRCDYDDRVVASFDNQI